MNRLAKAVCCLVALALPLALPGRAAAEDPAPIAFDGPLGSFTERRPARTAFATPEARQREVRRQAMAALSGHYRTLVAEVEGAGAAAPTSPVAALARAEMAEGIGALFAVASPAPEGEAGALPAIWDEPVRFAAFAGAFRDEAQALRVAVEAGAPLAEPQHAMRHACVACRGTFRRR